MSLRDNLIVQDKAADAVSVSIQVKWRTLHVSWSNIEDPVVLLERNLYGHPLAGLLWKRHFEEDLLELGWEKVPNLECLFVRRKQGLFLLVYVDDIKVAGKKQNMAHMWKKLMTNVDLDEPTSFLDHVFFRDALNVNANRTR